MRIYFSHRVLFLFDSAEKVPGNNWTAPHIAQLFARRPSAANITTLLESGVADISEATSALLDGCERAIEVSVRCDSGALVASGVDPIDSVLWRGRAGWVRVTVGQIVSPTEGELRAFVRTVEAPTDEPTCVRDGLRWLDPPLIETADAVRF